MFPSERNPLKPSLMYKAVNSKTDAWLRIICNTIRTSKTGFPQGDKVENRDNNVFFFIKYSYWNVNFDKTSNLTKQTMRIQVGYR